ncbi:pyrroloquinoline quinone biosynthesis peptide chaperone PqqD [Acidisphaera sp. L21]|uniref:pyrroloquinoline quinone biosynthesis peptide chaperone PqqD n=1 Tax=Acidisphaera sp. L21 TaxID=1641851 RepID=UPI001C207C01|nr:pyrroloquinoline quinone biosynthesis peptide chaperone PqqD [Acidisphaera sp. L21]
MTIEATIPNFATGVRLREDKVRGGWVVLAPERVFVPDEHAIAILQLVDGRRTVGGIVDALAAKFDAARDLIATDVIAMLQDLTVKGAIRL